MPMNFDLANDFDKVVKIQVAGIGGGGGNAVNRMISAGAVSYTHLATVHWKRHK